MGVRLAHHMDSALDIAHWLEGRADVAEVLHPGLTSFPGHALWKRDFKGASGVFSFVLKADRPEDWTRKAQAFLNALTYFGLGYSWGGYESLAVHVYLGDRRICKGPTTGPIIRLQIGLEDVKDLKADPQRGFAAARAPCAASKGAAPSKRGAISVDPVEIPGKGACRAQRQRQIPPEP